MSGTDTGTDTDTDTSDVESGDESETGSGSRGSSASSSDGEEEGMKRVSSSLLVHSVCFAALLRRRITPPHSIPSPVQEQKLAEVAKLRDLSQAMDDTLARILHSYADDRTAISDGDEKKTETGDNTAAVDPPVDASFVEMEKKEHGMNTDLEKKEHGMNTELERKEHGVNTEPVMSPDLAQSPLEVQNSVGQLGHRRVSRQPSAEAVPLPCASDLASEIDTGPAYDVRERDADNRNRKSLHHEGEDVLCLNDFEFEDAEHADMIRRAVRILMEADDP
jgi:hypothetical protein